MRWAFFRILQPWTWTHGSGTQRLETHFKSHYSVGFARGFDNGRSALHAVLDGAGVAAGDSVVIQAFTCVVVPNAIKATGGTPVYVDIDETYNIDPESLKKLLSVNTTIKAVIVQHTLGVPASIEQIQEICADHGVFLIEDCAHALGSFYDDRQIGSFGDAAIFSFGRDKVISSVSGGMAITNNPIIGAALNRQWKGSWNPSHIWVLRRLLHPLVFGVAKRFYLVASIGKVVIATTRWLNLLPLVLTAEEKNGNPVVFHKLPNAMSLWSLSQLERLSRFTAHRTEIASLYARELANFPTQAITPNSVPNYLRYSITVSDPKTLLQKAKNEGILLGDWYSTVIGPSDCSLEAAGYEHNSCSAAEELSKHIVNLPTTPTTTLLEARRVIKFIKTNAMPFS